MEGLRRAQSNLGMPEGRLLSLTDLQPPLSADDSGSAETFLALADVEPSEVATNALGYYVRKEIARRAASAVLDPGEFLENLPGEIQESDLLHRLVTEFAELQAGSTTGVGIGKKILQAVTRKRILLSSHPPQTKAAKTDSDELVNRNHASHGVAQEKHNKQIDRVADRIAKRTIKKIGKSDFPFTVKGGRAGRRPTLHSPAVYAAVSKKLAQSDVKIKVYRVHDRRTWDQRQSDRSAIADVMTVQGAKTGLKSKKTTDPSNPFKDPASYKAKQIYAGSDKRYIVDQAYPEVFWG